MKLWHIPLLILPMLPNLWAIWHVYWHSFKTPYQRLFWFFMAIFVPVLGGLAYLLIGRRQVVKRQEAAPAAPKNDTDAAPEGRPYRASSRRDS